MPTIWYLPVRYPNSKLVQQDDTIIPSRYPVAKTMPEEYEDLIKDLPADLRDPKM